MLSYPISCTELRGACPLEFVCFHFSAQMPEAELLCALGSMRSIFEQPPVLSTVAASTCVRTNRGPPSPHPRRHSFLVVFFDDSRSDRHEVASHCGCDLHFPRGAAFRESIGHLCVFLGEVSSQVLGQRSDWIGVCMCVCRVVRVLQIFWILTPYQTTVLQK